MSWLIPVGVDGGLEGVPAVRVGQVPVLPAGVGDVQAEAGRGGDLVEAATLADHGERFVHVAEQPLDFGGEHDLHRPVPAGEPGHHRVPLGQRLAAAEDGRRPVLHERLLHVHFLLGGVVEAVGEVGADFGVQFGVDLGGGQALAPG